jgi:hypothetical protein
MRDVFTGFLCGVVAMAALAVAIGHSESDQWPEGETAMAPEAAPYPDEPPPYDGPENSNAIWVPGHWKPLAAGESAYEVGTEPTASHGSEDGEISQHWTACSDPRCFICQAVREYLPDPPDSEPVIKKASPFYLSSKPADGLISITIGDESKWVSVDHAREVGKILAAY